jgi:hypothetical protein
MIWASISAMFVPMIIVVVVGAALAAYFIWGRNVTGQYDARLKAAAPGATVTVVEVGSSYVSKNYGVTMATLRLEVSPASGAPYRIISEWEVQPAYIGEIQVGKSIPVKVDAQNPKIVFPAVAWAKQYSLDEGVEEDLTG